MTTPAEAMSIIRAMYDLIDRQQWTEHAALVSEEFRSLLGSHAPMSFIDWQGRVKRIYEAFPDGRHVLNFYTVEGGRVLTVGRFQGVHSGPFLGCPATGKAISAAVMHVDRVEDGKLTEHIAQLDFAGLMSQIGANGEAVKFPLSK